MHQNRNKLPVQAVRLLQNLQSKGKSVFTRAEAMDALKIKGGHLNNLLHRIETEGWVKRLERGTYLIVPFEAGKEGSWSEHPYVIASYLVSPYCITYWSALSHWNYTEQLLNTTFVLTTARKFNQAKRILGQNYYFVRVKDKKFFGLTQTWVENRKINITDREKTLVDCLDHPEYCGGIVESAKAVKTALTDKKASVEKILEYAGRLGNRTVYKRLGYLIEKLELNLPDVAAECLKRISRGYSKLDPTAPKGGRTISRWQLMENVRASELKAD